MAKKKVAATDSNNKAPVAAAKAEPQQQTWVTDETGEPTPWTTGEAEEDAKWDGSNEPADIITQDPADPTEAYIHKLDTAPKFDGDWTGQSKKGIPVEEAEQQANLHGVNVTFEASPDAPPDFAGLPTALGEPESWESASETGEAVATADADLNTLDAWDAANPKTFTLNIVRHEGRFDSNTVKMMIYGETGTEKTRTAATFPNVIFADVDHGMSSVDRELDKVYVDDNENGFKQLQELYKFLAFGQHDYHTVVLDTLNEMQRVIMRFTVEEYTHIRRSYGNLPGQSDYGKMLYEFMELTRSFISLPMRVVLLAQVNTQEFDTDVLKPQLIGKNTARELLRKMDVVGYIYKTEAEEEGTIPEITFDSPTYVTKDRSNRLPAALPKPSYNRIAAYWK